jgi:hypothetical protein
MPFSLTAIAKLIPFNFFLFMYVVLCFIKTILSLSFSLQFLTLTSNRRMLRANHSLEMIKIGLILLYGRMIYVWYDSKNL